MLAFGGFEGAAPLAEEARNPRRTIQRAVLLATLLIGLLYVFTTYAVDVAYGPEQFANFTTGTGGRVLGGHGPLAVRRSSGSSCSWPSSTPPSPTPTPA